MKVLIFSYFANEKLFGDNRTVCSGFILLSLLDYWIFLKFVSSEYSFDRCSGWCCLLICGVECHKNWMTGRQEQKQYRVHTCGCSHSHHCRIHKLGFKWEYYWFIEQFNWLSETFHKWLAKSYFYLNFWGIFLMFEFFAVLEVIVWHILLTVFYLFVFRLYIFEALVPVY